MARLALSEIGPGHVDEISSAGGEPGWLRDCRRRSLEAYGELPLETSPLYGKYTDAKRMDPRLVSLDAGSGAAAPAFLARRLEELGAAPRAVMVGPRAAEVSLPDGCGLEVVPIGEALRAGAGPAREAVEAADPREDKFTALNGAAFTTGVFVRVPRGLELDEPLHLISCLPEDGTSAISRVVIEAEEGSRATVVQEAYSQASGGQQAHMELLSASVGPGARLDATTLQMMGGGSVSFSTRDAAVARDGSVNWYLGLFGADLSRHRIGYRLLGPGASASDSEVAFGSGGQSFDIQSTMSHEAPSTEGRVIEKSILRGRSRSLFKGMIRIGEGAAKSSSYLSGRSILLDAGAKSDAIPGLEILTNDVKATHSASVAQIDEEQVFYLQSRCLDRREAERTIVEGFLEPLSRRMSYQVRAWIAHLVESKWEGRELSISMDEELRRIAEVEETRYDEDAEIGQHYKYR